MMTGLNLEALDFKRTLDLSPLMARDLDGTILFWSKGCSRLYGWTSEDAVGRLAHELLRTVFPMPLSVIEAALSRDGEWQGDLRQTTKDGRDIAVRSVNVFRRDNHGRPVEIIESLSDVGVQGSEENDRSWINKKLEERVRSEVASGQALQMERGRADKMAALGTLAGGIAHDFNNVLQAVLGGVEIMRRSANDPEAHSRLATMVESAASRGLAVSDRLLSFAGGRTLKPENIDVTSIVSGLAEKVAKKFGKGLDVLTDVVPGLPDLVSDKLQLGTVLMDLAVNAFDAMPQGGRLWLAADEATIPDTGATASPGVVGTGTLAPGRYIKIIMTDEGSGMDRDILSHVTEPFFTTKPPGKGVGLGLAKARGFAEQSGGGLNLVSTPGNGTVVTLWLPAKEEAPIVNVPAVEEPRLGAKAAQVLVIDDDPFILSLNAEHLEFFGYSVLTAESGEDAIELVRSGGSPDIVLTDYSMPGLNGEATVRALRELMPKLPAIVLTGYSGVIEGMGDPADFMLLHKPLSAPKIRDAISSLLAHRRANGFSSPAD